MKLIEPSVSIISEDNPIKKIEIAGRTCYKSEKNITETSASGFVKRLIKSGHFAMLEHAVFLYRIVSSLDEDSKSLEEYVRYLKSCKFINVTDPVSKPDGYLVSANARAIIERGVNDPLYRSLVSEYPEFEYEIVSKIEKYRGVLAFRLYSCEGLTDDEQFIHKYCTMKFICDRGVSHELVRHRLFSFAQESTRYCNYANEGKTKELEFIRPSDYDDWSADAKNNFEMFLDSAEAVYTDLVTFQNLRPQQARAVLPNALKTEVVVTGNAKEWKHFFNLRYFGITGAPHPDMKKVAGMAFACYTGHRK